MLIVLDPPRRSHVIQSGETTRTMLVRLRSPRRRRSSTEMMGVPGTSPLPCASRSAFWTVVRCTPALAAIASEVAISLRTALVADDAPVR